MSSIVTGTRTGLVCALVLAILPRPACAQTVEELRLRVDSLVARWHVADEAATRADSIRVATAGLDTIRQGPLAVVAAPEWSAFASQSARMAIDQLTDIMGSDTSLLRSKMLYANIWDNIETSPPLLGEGDLGEVIVMASRGTEELSRKLVQAVGTMFAEPLDEAFERWTRVIPTERDVHPMHRATYIEMVTASSPVIHECYLGDMRACREALFPEASDDPATRWYVPDERRRVVSEINKDYLPDLASVQASCTEDGSDGSCITFLRSMPSGTLGTPFSGPAIHGLIRVALEVGGDGAFGRFVDTDSLSAESRVLRTVGVPIDSLLGIWHARVLAARPEPTIASPLALWGALTWFVLFAGMALRSTRWR